MKGNGHRIRVLVILQLMNILYSLDSVLLKVVSVRWEAYGLFAFRTLLCLLAAVVLLAVYAVLWQKILSQVDLTVAYMCKGMIVFWGMVWAALFFDERISPFNILGTMVIFGGVYLVTANE